MIHCMLIVILIIYRLLTIEISYNQRKVAYNTSFLWVNLCAKLYRSNTKHLLYSSMIIGDSKLTKINTILNELKFTSSKQDSTQKPMHDTFGIQLCVFSIMKLQLFMHIDSITKTKNVSNFYSILFLYVEFEMWTNFFQLSLNLWLNIKTICALTFSFQLLSLFLVMFVEEND